MNDCGAVLSEALAQDKDEDELAVQVNLNIYIFQPSDEGPLDAEAGDDETSPYCEWQLPAQCFCGLWESLLYGQVNPPSH